MSDFDPDDWSDERAEAWAHCAVVDFLTDHPELRWSKEEIDAIRDMLIIERPLGSPAHMSDDEVRCWARGKLEEEARC